MDGSGRDSRLIGTWLTWVGGVGAGLLALPVAMVGCIAFSIVGAGADPSHRMLECTTQECVSEWVVLAVACGFALVVIVSMLALVINASRRSLQVATFLGLCLATTLVGVALWARLADGAPGLLLLVAAIPGCLGLGSWLRVRGLPSP